MREKSLAIFCSPHTHGVTDRLGGIVCDLANINRKVWIRDLQIEPCGGCQICLSQNGQCILPADDADSLFNSIFTSKKLYIFAPIYFYSLPGQFKIFIDRSQKFWAPCYDHAQQNEKEAYAVLAAGRKNGEKLFAGAMLTLKYFLKPFGYKIAHALHFRGLEHPQDIKDFHRRQIEDMTLLHKA